MIHCKPILVPNDNARKLYAIRGKVEGYGERVSGRWIFKSRMPVVLIQLDEKQLELFNKIAREQMPVGDHAHPGIAPVLKIGMVKEAMKQFPVGSEVAITFGYAHVIDQFFTGAEALKVMDMRVVKKGDKIEHEVGIVNVPIHAYNPFQDAHAH